VLARNDAMAFPMLVDAAGELYLRILKGYPDFIICAYLYAYVYEDYDALLLI